MSNILVTGGCGFIGSNLVKALEKQGNKVWIIDDLSTGNEENLADCDIPEDRKIYRNLFSGFELAREKQKFKSNPLDLIYHLGIPSSSPIYKEQHSKTASAIGEFIYILDYCVKHKTPLVYASSSSIYNGHDLPHTENLKPYPLDYYTEARYSMERLAEMYSQLYDLPSIGLRFFSVYGPREKAKGDYANVITQMILKKKFTIYGNGTQTRDFTHVNDVVRALILAGKEVKLPGDLIYNVGTGRETSFTEVAEMIQKLTPLEIDYKKVNPLKNYVAKTCANTSSARLALGFEAKVTLEEGLEMQVREYA